MTISDKEVGAPDTTRRQMIRWFGTASAMAGGLALLEGCNDDVVGSENVKTPTPTASATATPAPVPSTLYRLGGEARRRAARRKPPPAPARPFLVGPLRQAPAPA